MIAQLPSMALKILHHEMQLDLNQLTWAYFFFCYFSGCMVNLSLSKY